ncbi:6-pyruvoyltetrahydropterin synthase [Capsulimonas corticalis]|uniref:6-carboxy-5,6,7,8-tetrahydropterin synthase n=1 Tax=Capsulimonas corticalis TaxID=2219043 RepID=A0A402CP07_9BACT|nr:6-carboxytetrahydropterin synthase [Capsulimonas corticalis]BDI33168.1 6-pyruvoyltetrahydropterin synthase [Capsulimonas corticalis]
MTIALCRRARFSAGDTGSLTGRAGGHDYSCELAVAGEIDPDSGMVVNIRDIDAVMKAEIVSWLDGKILDHDVPALRDTPATPENLTRFIWERCTGKIPPQGRLVRVTLWESDERWAMLSSVSRRKDEPLLTATRMYDFSASHRLHSQKLSEEENAEIFGKCNWENGHGHNYEIEVTLSGEPDSRTGEIAPMALLDQIVEEEVLRPFDHKHLNYDVPEFSGLNPTSENVTKVIWEKLANRLANAPLGPARLYRVLVRETPRNVFKYYGEEP